MIGACWSLGYARQTFFAAQGGDDAHANQVDAANPLRRAATSPMSFPTLRRGRRLRTGCVPLFA